MITNAKVLLTFYLPHLNNKKCPKKITIQKPLYEEWLYGTPPEEIEQSEWIKKTKEEKLLYYCDQLADANSVDDYEYEILED